MPIAHAHLPRVSALRNKSIRNRVSNIEVIHFDERKKKQKSKFNFNLLLLISIHEQGMNSKEEKKEARIKSVIDT